MKFVSLKGATSQIHYVWIRDSSSTVGAGLTGLAYNSGSLVASYVRPGGSRTAITLATQTVTGAFSSGGFVEVDATNMPGLYRFDVPDAVFATGVNNAVVMLKGATNMEPCVMEFMLTGVNLQDAVRAGLTALPNAAADAAGGLPISDAGGLDMDSIKSDTAAILVDTGTTLQAELDGIQADTEDIQARLPAALVGGRIDANVGAISGDSTAADNLETAFDDTAGAVPWQGIVDQGTAQAATATTIQLRSAAAFASDQLIGAVVTITGGSAGVGQSRTITDYDGSTDTATVDTWTTTPSGTITYKIFVSPPADSTGASIKTVTDKLNTMLELTSNSPGEWEFTADSLRNAPSGPGGGGGGLDEAGVRAALGMSSANLDTQLAAIKSDTAATLIDTAEIGAAGAGLTALASAANLATVAGYLDTEIAAILADTNELQTDWANGGRLDLILDARASQTSVDTLAGYVDTEVAAIKAKTDNLPASPAAVSDIPTATQNADALLNRDMSAVSDTNARSPLNALRFLRNKWSISGTTLTVTKENDSTSAWTSEVATTPGADPVTGNDPA